MKSFKEQFESQEYDMFSIPRVLDMDNDKVSINKKGLYPNELESMLKNEEDWEDSDLVLTEKLKVSSCGDWQSHIDMINKIHFESRDKFDNILMRRCKLTIPKDIKNIERISIQNALKQLYITLTINMDYYLEDRNRIETELNRKISDLDLKDDKTRKRIEQELFYAQMCKIIGVAETDDNIDDLTNEDTIYEKSFVLKDFRLLADDGNFMHATAQRGNYYLVFFYVN